MYNCLDILSAFKTQLLLCLLSFVRVPARVFQIVAVKYSCYVGLIRIMILLLN